MMVIGELQETFPRPGRVASISVRQERKKPVTVINSVEAVAGVGLHGDHYKNIGGSRQVTLIQKEHMVSVGSFLGKTEVDAGLTRRNIVVEGINLLSLKGKRFRAGMALLEYSGECHPCSRMEENLGSGGYNAMSGHGGITARVIESGRISVGDRIEVVLPEKLQNP